MTSSESEAFVSLRGITKRFPGVLANDNVNIDIQRGQVLGLLGENGAGKSTLVKILYGFYQKDAGEIYFNGRPVEIQTPFDARNLHIGMVFQDMTLIPAMSVIENIALFLPTLEPVPDVKLLANRVEDLSARYRLHVDPWAPIWQLSVGEQQKVEVLKLLLADSQLLILDEPTRVLAPHEVEGLFQVFKHLKQDGYAIIFITHKLHEVLACADRITIMRHGRVADTLKRSDANEKTLISLMFESEPPDQPQPHLQAYEEDVTPLLELKDVSTRGQGLATSLRDITLTIMPGEILGIAGVSGNGQRELGDLILGLEKPACGTLLISGMDATRWSPLRVRRSGVAFIPENPLNMAVVPSLTVQENMALGDTRKYALQGGLAMDWPRVRQEMATSFERLSINVPKMDVPVRTLSGGNLQRLVLARELVRDPSLIIALYPTRGLDVMSATAARRLLVDARDLGKGVLLISEDLGELFSLSDRLIVMHQGRIVGESRPSDVSVTEIGYLMTGSELKHDDLD